MKFQTYLNEGRTKTINADTAYLNIIDRCKKNFKIMYDNKTSIKLYRGFTFNDDFGIVDTNKGKERESAYTENYYTLLFDNLPSWKKFPKRSRGLVCSTNMQYASNYGYGQPFYVIPFDDSKIAVAPSHDIWESFKVFCTKYDLFSMDDFNVFLNQWFKRFNIKKPNTYEELKKALISLNELVKKGKEITKIPDTFIFDTPDVMKLLDKELSPIKNYFKLGIENLKKNREVWIQGKSIILGYHGYNMLKDDLEEFI
jgi:hypothetical protein